MRKLKSYCQRTNASQIQCMSMTSLKRWTVILATNNIHTWHVIKHDTRYERRETRCEKRKLNMWYSIHNILCKFLALLDCVSRANAICLMEMASRRAKRREICDSGGSLKSICATSGTLVNGQVSCPNMVILKIGSETLANGQVGSQAERKGPWASCFQCQPRFIFIPNSLPNIEQCLQKCMHAPISSFRWWPGLPTGQVYGTARYMIH